MNEPLALALTACACLVGHGLADGLQGRLSGLKRRVRQGHAKFFWQWAPFLAIHGGWHAVAVGLALGSPLAMACEWLAHCCIDLCKCEGRIGSVADQALHVACKGVWIAIWGAPQWAKLLSA